MATKARTAVGNAIRDGKLEKPGRKRVYPQGFKRIPGGMFSNGVSSMTTADKVREYLKTAEPSRHGMSHAATALGYAESTLGLLLRNERITYLSLRDAERKARAKALLARNRHADLPAIMRATGYAQASTSRAMRRWFGGTLPEVRESL